MSIKNYVLCTNLEAEGLKSLERVIYDLDVKNSVIHIVRIVEIQTFGNEHYSGVYPEEKDYPALETYTYEKTFRLEEKLKLNHAKVINKCFFEINREDKILNYLKEINADLVVTATRGKHGIDGFFSSSFTDFLCKFSPCDVLVMREKKN
jgi:nucleotide-binding universal stress UspA family protein